MTFCILSFMVVFGQLLIATHSADADIKMSDVLCEAQYHMEINNSIIFEFSGSDKLLSNPCSVEFIKKSSKKQFCISTLNASLSCDTELEYHESFVKNYIDPEKEIVCNESKVEEWCTNEYVDEIFVVLRKPPSLSDDFIRLHIYLEDVPDYDSEERMSPMIMAVIIAPIVILSLVTIFHVVKYFVRRKERESQPQAAYHTTSGNVDFAPVSQAGYPAQETVAPEFQHGGYTIHEMKSSCPVGQSQPTANSTGLDPERYPPVQPMGCITVPPPTYGDVKDQRNSH